MTTPLMVDRPVLRYHGGKFRLAPWVLAHLPAHRVYALFEETRQERAKSVSWKDFDRPDATPSLPDLILSMEEEHTS